MKIDEWGIKRHYTIGDSNRIQRFFRSLTHRALSTRTRLAFRNFYDDTGWPYVYEALRFYESHGVVGINRDKWAKIANTPLGSIVDRIARVFPIRYPQASLIKKKKYDVVILTHPLDAEGVIIAQIAKRAGVPVICIVTGIDHLFTGGPIMMEPDLLLVWGPEQNDNWQKHHSIFLPKLKKTKIVQTGGLAHDRLISETDTKLFEIEYPEIDPDAKVVTFVAFLEWAYPGQKATCDAILKRHQLSSVFATVSHRSLEHAWPIVCTARKKVHPRSSRVIGTSINPVLYRANKS
jgi:hypothetical protein